MNSQKLIIYIPLFIAFMICWFVLAISYVEVMTPAQPQSVEYCEMVDLHNQTGKQYGWPDYKNNFQYCVLEDGVWRYE